MTFDPTLNLGNCISFILLILAILKINKDNTSLIVTLQGDVKNHRKEIDGLAETSEDHEERIRTTETNVAVLSSTAARKGSLH